MRFFFTLSFIAVLLAALSHPVAAQASRPAVYEFMTLSLVESPYAVDTRLLLTPAFKGQSEVKLEEVYNLSANKYREHLQHNTQLVNATLGELSEAGWELFNVQASTVGSTAAASVTRYLFRKPRP